jgi:type IV pilus assembly protein PilC
MAVEYKFQAKGPDGRILKGVVKAQSPDEVKAKLRSKAFTPISVQMVQKSKGLAVLGPKKLNNKEFQIFLRQLSIMLKSGVPLLDSLESLKDSAFSKSFVKVLTGIIEDINSGLSLSDAMNNTRGVFGPMVVNLVKAGEEGGVLDEVLDRLGQFFEKRQKLKNKIQGALIYPVATIVIAIGVLVAVLVFVVPKFKEIFESQGQELPGMTQFVVNLSENFVSNIAIIMGVLVGGPIAFIVLYRMGITKPAVDRFVFKIPLFGDLIKRGSIARMSRTLSVLLRSGVRLNEGLEISRNTIENAHFQNIIGNAKEDIVTGKPFSYSLKKNSSFFPNLVVQMISTGEKTGNLDGMLEKMADFYEDEVEATADQLTSLLEPVIIIVLGGMIGFLVISMFMPIFNLGGAVG